VEQLDQPKYIMKAKLDDKLKKYIEEYETCHRLGGQNICYQSGGASLSTSDSVVSLFDILLSAAQQEGLQCAQIDVYIRPRWPTQ